MSDESDAFLDGAGLLGRPLSVGKDPPCLLESKSLKLSSNFVLTGFFLFLWLQQGNPEQEHPFVQS